MRYGDLADRLDAAGRDEPRTVLALPDGSVDRHYAVRGLEGDPLADREAFGRQLGSGDGDTFGLEARAVRPGGQAVNAALQARALGEDVTLVGTLDHPILAFPFETRSTGEPSRIAVLSFDGDEVLFAEPSPAADDWDLATLASALDLEAIAAADAVCVGNWASFRGLEAVFDHLAADADDRTAEDRRPDGPPIVLDPGALAPASEAELRGLFASLAGASTAADVLLSVSRVELEAAAEAVDVGGDGPGALVREVRAATGIDGVVYHGSDAAVGATREAVADVEMIAVDEVATTTGAGDRFSAGLACALARGWPLEAALALGNACAAYFVAHGETGDADDLAAFVRDRTA